MKKEKIVQSRKSVITFLEDLKQPKKEKKLEKSKSDITEQFAKERGLKVIRHKLIKSNSFNYRGLPFVDNLGNVQFHS